MPKAQTALEKIDLFKQHAQEYAMPRTPALVQVGPARYLAVDGSGAPGGDEFQQKIGALYSVAYTAKMSSKFGGCDYKVAPLEALWWSDPDASFLDVAKEHWQWQLLIRIPEFIGKAQVAAARDQLLAKGKPVLVGQVDIEQLKEGTCVQMLYVGPYCDEAPSIRTMRDFAAAQGYKPAGKHHEIYLSDPRRVAPEKLRTILRQPVRK
jgi:hypothetical protein